MRMRRTVVAVTEAAVDKVRRYDDAPGSRMEKIMTTASTESASITGQATGRGAGASSAASAGQTVLDVFAARVEASGERTALRSKVAGRWQPTTWLEWDRASREVAGGLVGLGVEVGDRVVILANTREDWVLSDVGILMAGAVTVPIYPSNLPEPCEYIINDCGACVVIVEDPHQLEKLLDPAVRSRLGRVRKVVMMSELAVLERPDASGRTEVRRAEVLPPGHADEGGVMSLSDLRESGRGWLGANPNRLGEIARAIDPGQACTIVYTSGTTGPTKGVVLTHANLAFECEAVKNLLGIGEEDEQVLFLPLAHIFAKLLEWAAITVGATTAFAESVPKLIENLGEVRPTFMGAVPRVYEKAYAKIQGNFEDKRKKLVPRLLVDFALGQGKLRSRIEQRGGRASGLGVKLADKLVFSKIRNIFGGRVKYFISGGAPLSREIAEFFHAAGILILEGYGLTETTAATHINRPDSFEFGTVGPALPGVEVRIAPDGEILMRGGNIMKEYYGKPEATAEVIDADGWFHSGDIGVIEANGHLRITDRKKDIIVTAGGKNVAPQNIENSFKALCPLASQMMVYGDKRKYLTALITLSPEAIEDWARAEGVSYRDHAELTQKPQVRELIQGYVDTLNRGLESYQSIKKFAILPRDFDQDSGELTPTLKVKRKHCTEKYGDILEGFY
jgi:long-chain acyl-CoA synthetase